jgi:acyl carrier protein
MEGQLMVAGRAFVAPRNALEEKLAQIWADLLQVSNISIFDNFFELGGHSLLAGRVLGRISAIFGVSLPIRTLFQAPILEQLARQVAESLKKKTNNPSLQISRVGEQGPLSVSIVQEHVLCIERELPGLPQFNLPLAYRLEGPLNVPALKRSLTEIARRHHALRTRFDWVERKPVGLVTPMVKLPDLLTLEVLAPAKSTRSDRQKALLLQKAELRFQEEALRPFDVRRAPLFRARLLVLDPTDHVLIFVLHHIIVDGWSIELFFNELSKLYGAFSVGQIPQLSAPPLQFSDFARWQRWWCTTDAAARQLAFWRQYLRHTSPMFCSSANAAQLLSSPSTTEPLHLPNDLVARLRMIHLGQGATLFMTLLTAFKALLMARSGRKDICIATAMANRSLQNTEAVIGPFENTVLIRTQVDPDLSFVETLDHVRDSILDSYSMQEFPFETLAARLSEGDGLDSASLVQVVFVLQHAFGLQFHLPGIVDKAFGDVSRAGQPALPIDRSWLVVTLKETASGITGLWRCKRDLFGPDTLESWVADYKTILTKVAESPKTTLGRLLTR